MKSKNTKKVVASRHRRATKFWKRPHPYILLVFVALVSWLFTLPVRSPRLDAVITPLSAPSPHSPLFGTEVRNIPYCYGQMMDIYGPRTQKYDKSPVVMYIHGGGWEINTKSTEPGQLAMIDGLRDKGYAIVSIDYRLMPKNHFPAPVEDTLCSVRYLRAHAEEYDLDPTRVALYGFSAGGYLAAMAGVLDSHNDFTTDNEPYNAFSSRPQAVVTLAGFFDLSQQLTVRNEARITTFLDTYKPSTAEPVAFVTPDDPPFLLIHGADDQFVKIEQDVLMSRRLTAAGVYHEQVVVRHALHGLEPNGDPIDPSLSTVRGLVQNFIERFLFPFSTH